MRKIKIMAVMLSLAMLFSACGSQNDGVTPQEATPALEQDSSATEAQSVDEAFDVPEPVTESGGQYADVGDLPFFAAGQNDLDTSSGSAFETLIPHDDLYNYPQANHVVFGPGNRSGWHTHGAMVVLVTGGVGYYQEEGKEAQILREGDMIQIEEGVLHWHGAAPDSWFSQIVIYDSEHEIVNGGSVTDEHYNNLDEVEYAGRTEKTDDGFMFSRAETPMNSSNFTGPVYVSSILGSSNVLDMPGLSYVVFDKGVYNNWHTHEGGQILIVTDGIGYHQIEGEEVQVLYPGDVAFCSPGETHWHGGSADSEFAHIAINTNPGMNGVTWLDRISGEEYAGLSTGN